MKIVWWGMGLLVLMTVVVWQQWPNQLPVVTMCDVGQGDALVITEGFSQLVIDTGPKDGGVSSCLGSVMPFWDRFVETVVVTHADGDHMGGLDSILERYRVGKVITAEAAYDRVKAVVNERTSVVVSWQNHQWQVRSIRGEVKWPPKSIKPSLTKFSETDDNRLSLVVRLWWGNESLWLAGDADETVEENLLQIGAVEPTMILKVGHHGSTSASSAPFLAVLRPFQAWISVGKGNRYGHPTREVLERLKILGTVVRRTDEEGLIR